MSLTSTLKFFIYELVDFHLCLENFSFPGQHPAFTFYSFFIVSADFTSFIRSLILNVSRLLILALSLISMIKYSDVAVHGLDLA